MSSMSECLGVGAPLWAPSKEAELWVCRYRTHVEKPAWFLLWKLRHTRTVQDASADPLRTNANVSRHTELRVQTGLKFRMR